MTDLLNVDNRQIKSVLTDLKDAFEHESPAMSERTRLMIREAYLVIVALVGELKDERNA